MCVNFYMNCISSSFWDDFAWSWLSMLGSGYSDIQGPLICPTKGVCNRERDEKEKERVFDQSQGQRGFCSIKLESLACA